jgi:hypothetical protein
MDAIDTGCVQQIGNESRELSGLALNNAGHFCHARVLVGALQQARDTHDGRQGVAQFMREHAQEFFTRVGGVALPLLQPALLADIGQAAQGAHDGAIRVKYRLGMHDDATWLTIAAHGEQFSRTRRCPGRRLRRRTCRLVQQLAIQGP